MLAREVPGAPHEVLLMLDATVGQNALSQAKQFQAAVGVTGIALTKLDGTARGGIVVAIAEELKIPVRLIGVEEGSRRPPGFSCQGICRCALRTGLIETHRVSSPHFTICSVNRYGSGRDRVRPRRPCRRPTNGQLSDIVPEQ